MGSMLQITTKAAGTTARRLVINKAVVLLGLKDDRKENSVVAETDP